MPFEPAQRLSSGLIVILALIACLAARAESPEELERQVRDAETAFADTMARRDLAAFRTFLADEAVFFGKDGAVHGRDAVVADWAPFFEAPKAPFSWYPQTVEVLASGTLAISSGPVNDAQGRQIEPSIRSGDVPPTVVGRSSSTRAAMPARASPLHDGACGSHGLALKIAPSSRQPRTHSCRIA